MAKFEAGNDPADHSVAEVVEFLGGDPGPTADEYERIMTAEREGKGRVGIISLSGAAEPAAAPEPAVEEYDDDAPASLGPDKPTTDAEAEAHADTVDMLEAAEDDQPEYVAASTQHGTPILDADGNEIGRKYTPDEALKVAVEAAQAWKTRPSADAQ